MRARYQHVVVEALGIEVPPHRVTSAQLEARLVQSYERLGLKPGTLAELSGVIERRFFDPSLTPHDAAVLAARKALGLAGRAPNTLGIVVNTSVDRVYFEPATAALVHHRLGLERGAQAIDVSNACLGFLNGMATVANLIELGHIDAGLVVDGEASGVRSSVELAVETLAKPQTTLAQFADSAVTLTFGCGAAAVVLARKEKSPFTHSLDWLVSANASQHSQLCLGQTQSQGYVVTTNANAMLRRGVALLRDTFDEACEAFDARTVDWVFGHQVGASHTEAVARATGLRHEQSKQVFPIMGNVGPAGLPLAWGTALEEGLVKEGQRVELLGIGSGLSSMVMGLRW